MTKIDDGAEPHQVETFRVGAEQLQRFARDVFIQVGLPPEDADTEAEVLVWANLRGVDSHGVLRIPWYVDMVDAGTMNPRPKIRVEKETAATLLIDADHALGPVVTTLAMKRAMHKAREVGIGWGVIRNTTHQGAIGYYSVMAAMEGMAGIALVCSPPNMAPYGAKAPGVHNSPITIAVPGKQHHPLLLDMSTSIAAGGKLRLAVDRGMPIPQGWALTTDGEPTTDPKLATILLPAGGPKGSGLALMFETLSGLMVGNPVLIPMLLGHERVRRHRQNSVVAAINIATFTDLERYRQAVDGLVEGLKTLPKADGIHEILVPGEREARTCVERTRDGIPLPEGTVRRLRAVAERFSVEMPPMV